MDIFVLDRNPITAAKLVPIKVAHKMSLEIAQMLAVACHEYGLTLPHKKDGSEYSPNGHVSHPCTRWVCNGKANMKWACIHALALIDRHFERYGTTPAQKSAIIEVRKQITDHDWINHTPFVWALKIPMPVSGDVVLSYLEYIKTKPYYDPSEV